MSLLSWLLKLSNPTPVKGGCRVVAARTPDGRQIAVVQRGTRSLWQEKDWEFRNGQLHGRFNGTKFSFPGRIEKPFEDPQYYIYHVPHSVLVGEHGACFQERGAGLHWVHFYPVPKDVNSGIMRLEHFLKEDGL